MSLAGDLSRAVTDMLSESFKIIERKSDVVPKPTKDGMAYDTGIRMPVTYLYSDMADSTGLINVAPPDTISAILRAYLEVTVRIVRSHQGHIRSFDGDRVMGVFAGDGKEARAVESALKIKHVVRKVIQPAIAAKYTSIKNSEWELRAATGIASGPTTMIRVGIRNNDDMVSIGVAPNLAARLSERRDGIFSTFIGAASYERLSPNTLLSNGESMWQGPFGIKMGGGTYNYYKSSYMRAPTVALFPDR